MSRRAFTLVEMLVVLGIIAVLVALLMPAVMAAINNARRAAIGAEISALDKAIEQYKQKTGDYPPNFRVYNHFIRHVQKRFPKIDPAHLNTTIEQIWGPGFNMSNPPTLTDVPRLDEGESLVFWLYLVDNDPRYPFKAAAGTPTTTPPATAQAALLAAASPEKIYPFKEDRFVNNDGDQFPAYRALYSKDTCYLYVDSRAYNYFVSDFTNLQYAAYADGNYADGYYARPYWSENVASTTPSVTYKPVNPTTFQILCAGQDGDFGLDASPAAIKYFPGGGGPYQVGDRDNMTNFSEGRRLEDHIP
jgi:prepilin-type N-terminal cleavage/methylation domain-containing protein